MNPEADATTRAPRATRRSRVAAVGARVRRAAPETLVFAGATTLLLLHALDDALLHREAGVPAGRHAVAAAIALAAAVAAVVEFPRLRPGVRAALAFLFGALAAVNGMLHVLHVVGEGPAASDATGVIAAAAALVLMALAVAIPWRHRGERAGSRWRRWAIRVVAAPAALLGAALIVAPIGLAIVDVHKYRESVGAPPSAAYQDVTFPSSDGLRLAGWYRPSRNGAAVVVVHGGGSDRKGSIAHARILARHGYGVLLYDARGRGEARAARTRGGGGGRRTPPARSRSSSGATTSIPVGSVGSASRAAATRSSTSRPRTGTSTRSSPTAPRCARSRTPIA